MNNDAKQKVKKKKKIKIINVLSNIQVVSSISLSQCMIHSFLYVDLNGADLRPPTFIVKLYSVIQHTEHGEWETQDFFCFVFQYSNWTVKVEMLYTILNIRTRCVIYNIYCKTVNQVR